ncbi:MAG: hypothetical protein NWQ54_21180 [Paraglaciecola sp.]|uniref:hypothetical protein n=1 Tax=Paraglaciecola sp. TaxID=1920173 RepID=UPI00273F5291|nr:hypothetical protein [Paraglaciecola sp.]MDP5031792.1 hypothetical protein [Paraglaciecola sp.]MDP5133403.1 hypothetical protein [Paraglaciecola sp.]
MSADIDSQNLIEINGFTQDFEAFLKSNKFCKKSYKVRFRKLNNTICVREGENDFYLRYKPERGWLDNSIVIARIGFSEERVGNGTKFLRFLVENSQKYAIDNIFIETANDICGKFAQKYGFIRWSDGHWFTTSSLLKARLNDCP